MPIRRRLLLVLPPLVAFQAISTDLYLPALPAIVLDLGTEVAAVQLTLSVFLLGFGLAQLVYGPLSDRIGRRPLLLFGTGLYVVASLACMVASSIGTLVAARFLQAVGACCGPVLGRAVVRDVWEPEEAARVLAYLAAAMTLAPAAGPILGGLLTAGFGWRSTFAALALFGTLLLAGVALLLPETNRRRDPTATRPGRLVANYGQLLRDRRFQGFAAVAAFTYCGIFAFISGSSYLLIEVVGLAPVLYGLCFAAIVAGYAAGSLAAARLSPRLGIEGLLALGTAIEAAGGGAGLVLAFLLPPSVPTLVVPQLVFMVGAGLALPSAMAGGIGPFPEKAGLASGLLGFCQLMVAALIGVAIGALYDGTGRPMMGALAVVGAAAALAYHGLVRADRASDGRT